MEMLARGNKRRLDSRSVGWIGFAFRVDRLFCLSSIAIASSPKSSMLWGAMSSL